MKCIHCGKEINKNTEKYELHGIDGDFIHIKCKENYYNEMDRVLNMTDTEFKDWLIGKAI